jgi:acetate kinase
MPGPSREVKRMHEPILVINAGSSSIKFSVFETGADRSVSPAAHGEVEGIGTASRLSVTDPQGRSLAERPVVGDDYESAITAIYDYCVEDIGGQAKFTGVGHRVVHGGARFSQPVLIDAQVIAALEALAPLAPLHQPHHIAAIRAVASAASEVPQVACFDTAFHQTQPALAQRFTLPRALVEKGVRRYGFHGLSYEYIVSILPQIAPDNARGSLSLPISAMAPACARSTEGAASPRRSSQGLGSSR